MRMRARTSEKEKNGNGESHEGVERNREMEYVFTERVRLARMRYIIAYTYIHIRFYVLSNPRGSKKKEENELNIGYPLRK